MVSFHSRQSFSVSFFHVGLGLPAPRLPSIGIQYTKRVFTIFHVGFGVSTLCLAQSRWFHGDGHRGFQVIQRDSQRDEERGVIIDFREILYCGTVSLGVRERNL